MRIGSWGSPGCGGRPTAHWPGSYPAGVGGPWSLPERAPGHTRNMPTPLILITCLRPSRCTPLLPFALPLHSPSMPPP